MKSSLLLGAGFSYHFGMPLAAELSEVFFGLFTENDIDRLACELSKHRPYGEEYILSGKAMKEVMLLLLDSKSNKEDYESFLAKVQKEGDAPGKSQPDRHSYQYFFATCYDIVHAILSGYQNESYNPVYQLNKKWFSNFSSILSDEETWAFTLNHDLYLECLAADMGIPATYGDVDNIAFPISNVEMDYQVELTCSRREDLSIDSEGFFRGKNGLNIVKLHGGINELEYKDRSIICNPRLDGTSSSDIMTSFRDVASMCYFHQGVRFPSGKDRFITNADGELDIVRKSVLTGGKKYSTTSDSKEGEEKLKIFDDVLRESDQLTIVGYGFGDTHINFRISNAMVLNSKLKIKIIDPYVVKVPEFLGQFDYEQRVIWARCGAAQWMDYCKEQTWNMLQEDALLASQKYRESVKNAVVSNWASYL